MSRWMWDVLGAVVAPIVALVSYGTIASAALFFVAGGFVGLAVASYDARGGPARQA